MLERLRSRKRTIFDRTSAFVTKLPLHALRGERNVFSRLREAAQRHARPPFFVRAQRVFARRRNAALAPSDLRPIPIPPVRWQGPRRSSEARTSFVEAVQSEWTLSPPESGAARAHVSETQGNLLRSPSVSHALDVLATEVSFGEQGVVRSTHESQIFGRRRTAERERVFVMNLETGTFMTAASAHVRKRAPPTVASPDVTTDRRGNVTARHRRPLRRGWLGW